MQIQTVSRDWKKFDFEAFGSQAARETRDLAKAIDLGGLKIFEYEAALRPDLDRLQDGIAVCSDQKLALCAQLYDPDDPVDDKAMIARKMVLNVLKGVLVGVVLMSVAAHAYRLALFGLGLLLAVGGAVVATLFIAGVGYLACDTLFRKTKVGQDLAIGTSTCLMVVGLFQLASAGGMAVATTPDATPSAATSSYVDGAASDAARAVETPKEPDEQHIKQLMTSAVTNIALSADLMLGILLNAVVLKQTDRKYATWKKIELLEKEIAHMQWQMKLIIGSIEVAKRQCMAGILRFFHTQRKQPPAYFKAGAACLFLLLVSVPDGNAQTAMRKEAILIDASGSIGAGGANGDLFREYLSTARQLLQTEPANSRVVVALITSESFGSTRELIKGWTPAARGVFTDDLNRARRQLGSAFETKTAGVTPISGGTDIIGGLWRIKALLEPGLNTDNFPTREIWIFSDMVNETPSLPMPILLPSGADRMFEQAQEHSLIVPLRHYRIHVVGASTRGLSPQAWNTVKAFWTRYCEASGAELVSYSVEVSAER